MKFKNENDRLYIFIIISLVAHLLIFYFMPWGGLSGSLASDGADMRDFEFIQVVNFEPIPDEPAPAKEQVNEKPSESEPEPEPEPESEPELDEIEDSEPELESEVAEEPESNPEPEPEEDMENEENSSEETPELEDEQVVTVEESETEVEQSEKDINAEKEPEEIEEAEEIEETEVPEETVNPELEEDSTQAESDTTETEEETPPSPGELIQTSPLPVYPKDLVGDAQTGTVLIEANISPEGEILSVKVEESSGIDIMDRNALSTVERGWSFRTYNRPYFMSIEVNYNVDERGNPLIDVQLLDISFE